MTATYDSQNIFTVQATGFYKIDELRNLLPHRAQLGKSKLDLSLNIRLDEHVRTVLQTHHLNVN